MRSFSFAYPATGRFLLFPGFLLRFQCSCQCLREEYRSGHRVAKFCRTLILLRLSDISFEISEFQPNDKTACRQRVTGAAAIFEAANVFCTAGL